jgi:hypothetical protein
MRRERRDSEMAEDEGMPPGTGGGGGPLGIPISAQVDPAGQVTIEGMNYNKFTVNLSSTNGQAQTVNISVPSGCSVNPSSVSINPPFAGTCTVFVPVTNNSTVAATASETGYMNKSIPIQGSA